MKTMCTLYVYMCIKGERCRHSHREQAMYTGTLSGEEERGVPPRCDLVRMGVDSFRTRKQTRDRGYDSVNTPAETISAFYRTGVMDEIPASHTRASVMAEAGIVPLGGTDDEASEACRQLLVDTHPTVKLTDRGKDFLSHLLKYQQARGDNFDVGWRVFVHPVLQRHLFEQ
jgi:hypothetical protein